MMKIKKIRTFILVTAVVLACLGGNSIKSHADTGKYDFTVKKTNTYDSHYAKKAGGSKFENCAWITPSYFSKVGTVWFWVKMKGQNVRTEELSISYGSETVSRHPYYTSTPTSGLDYHVGARIGTISSGDTIRVKGAFTP